jgi:flavin reductase (DIM6/NTAB) family NADH-FMN oxidoreductase RutF
VATGGDGPVEFDLPVGGGFVAPGGFGDEPWESFPEEEELQIEGEPGADPAIALRRTLGMFATGVTVITTKAEDQIHGMTANAFMSVSLRPPLIVISVDRRARMHRLLAEGVRFAVNVLASDQEELSDRFAGRAVEGGVEVAFDAVGDTPTVRGALATLVARVVRSSWGGDHSLFVGQVEYARYGEGEPLLFHGGRYEHLLGHVPAFAAMSDELMATIVAAGSERSFAPGELVVKEGDPGEELFVVVEGDARVQRGGRVLSRLGAGELFGEVSVIDGRPRSADVVAETALRCLAIPRGVLREALAAEPRAAWAMLELLAGRLRED